MGLLQNGQIISEELIPYGGIHTSLMFAATGGHLEVVRVLLDRGADVNEALSAALSAGRIKVAKLLKDRGADLNLVPLTLLTLLGDVEVVQSRINQGANIDETDNRGCSPLIVAAKWGYLEIVKLLLDNGADVNAWAWDTMEQTALMEASDQGHVELVKFLLQKGANVNFRNKNGWTALKLAQKEDHTQIAELLKAHGAKE